MTGPRILLTYVLALAVGLLLNLDKIETWLSGQYPDGPPGILAALNDSGQSLHRTSGLADLGLALDCSLSGLFEGSYKNSYRCGEAARLDALAQGLQPEAADGQARTSDSLTQAAAQPKPSSAASPAATSVSDVSPSGTTASSSSLAAAPSPSRTQSAASSPGTTALSGANPEAPTPQAAASDHGTIRNTNAHAAAASSQAAPQAALQSTTQVASARTAASSTASAAPAASPSASQAASQASLVFPARPADKPMAPGTVLVVGDSLAVSLAVSLEKACKEFDGMNVVSRGKIASGLQNPQYFNWEQALNQFLGEFQPRLVVVMMGANDAKYLSLDPEAPEPSALADKRRAAYEARLAKFLAVMDARGVASYWLGLPVMGDADLNAKSHALNALVRQACQASSGGRFLDTSGLLAGPGGSYAQHLPDAAGHRIRVREADKIHFSVAGGDIIVRELLRDARGLIELKPRGGREMAQAAEGGLTATR